MRWWKCMSVNVMNGLHYKCQSVNQASFLEREPTKVFLHGCHTLVSVPVLVHVSCTFIVDGFECLDSGLLMRVPHDAAIFHGWSYQTIVYFTSDRRCGSTREIMTNHVGHSDTLGSNPFCLLFPGDKTINVFRACLGAQLTICAKK